jgi:hypothetical protein
MFILIGVTSNPGCITEVSRVAKVQKLTRASAIPKPYNQQSQLRTTLPPLASNELFDIASDV